MSAYGVNIYGGGLYGLGIVSGPTDLYALCEELLTASIDALDTLPGFDPDLVGAPERAFVSPGQPAFDCCDQLTVNAAAITEAATQPPGLAAGRRNVTGRINHVGLAVTITRCVPVARKDTFEPEPPSAEDLAGAAAQLDADAWVLWNHLWNLWAANELFRFCDEVFFDGLRSITNSGGCGGWILNLRVRLDGYNEAATS